MIPPDTSAPMGWRGLPPGHSKRRREAQRKRDTQLARQRVLRASMVMALITALIAILAYRLVYWQVIMREELLARANKPSAEPPAQLIRGTIRDHNGYLLATDSVSYRFGVSPNIVSYKDPVAEEVAEITNRDQKELRAIFEQDAQYVLIDSSIPYTMGQQLNNMKESSLKLEPLINRSYPNGTLASHLLGFVNAEQLGVGVEMYYNELLNGEKEVSVLEGEPLEKIQLSHRAFTPTPNGVDLILTIDRAIQFRIEQELAQAIEKYEALGGTIIVMNPKTGDILGMASSPDYDPNKYYDYSNSIFQDPAISLHYEPGSVFKVITIAAALDAGVLSPDMTWNDSGSFEVGGNTIQNWDKKGYGTSNVTEILGYSLNTGTAWISTQLGSELFYKYVKRFGFGQPTGIELSNEAPGKVRSPSDESWYASDLATNSFGQGIAVTPIQMISSVASLLNNGQLMQPRIVKAIVSHGQIEEKPPYALGQSVSPQVAQTMQKMMVDAVELGTKQALLNQDGWDIGGKTGTAQVPIPGGYHADDTIASFIGFAPADNPAFIVLVKLDRPLGEYQWGSKSAAPAFKNIAHYLLHHYNIPPDEYRIAQPTDMPTALPMPTSGIQMGIHATPTP
ncbi:MAG: peptidoglycan D,D-transpeptidase FtsI family protein [Ardenticatenaceae bacterium]